MCDRAEALKILAQVYEQCAPIVPISDVYLYGSYTRGDYTRASDVDIMLISPLTPEKLHDHRWDFAHVSSEISMDHDVTVSLTVRSGDQFRPETIPLHRNVIKDGVRYAPAGV